MLSRGAPFKYFCFMLFVPMLSFSGSAPVLSPRVKVAKHKDGYDFSVPFGREGRMVNSSFCTALI
jgi:hypothetical protein